MKIEKDFLPIFFPPAETSEKLTFFLPFQKPLD
jgi:hypothetical protein